MSTPTRRRTKKEVWPPERWAEFGRRCQEARDRYRAVLNSLNGCGFFRPGTVGRLKAADLDKFIGVRDAWHRGMVQVENALVGQHPSLDMECLAIIHGRNGSTPELPPIPPRVGVDDAILSREHWVELGAELYAIRDLMLRLAVLVSNEVGRRPGAKFHRAQEALDSMRCRLDSLVCQQHPDWEDATRVIYCSSRRPPPLSDTPLFPLDAPAELVEIELVRDILDNGREIEAGTVIVLSEERARPMLENGWARRTRRRRPAARG